MTDIAALAEKLEAMRKRATPGWHANTKDPFAVISSQSHRVWTLSGSEQRQIHDPASATRVRVGEDREYLLALYDAAPQLTAAVRAERWQPIETAPKTDPATMVAIPLLGWCPDETAPLGGDVRAIWWEPVMQLDHEKAPRARWWGDRDIEEHPTFWMPSPAGPEPRS